MKKNKIYLLITSLAIALLSYLAYTAFHHYNSKSPSVEIKEAQKVTPVKPKPKIIKFGLVIDSLQVEENLVRRNETLLEIFNRYNLSSDLMKSVVLKSEKKFNLNSIRAGRPYTAYYSNDSINKLKMLVYEAGIADKVIFKFIDTFSIERDVKYPDTIRRSIAGYINSSVYETLQSLKASPALAYELSKIFSSKVDFFKIQEGDHFKIIYDELNLEGQPIGIQKIYSASFQNNGETFYAFNFPQNGKEEFFDEKGLSMQRGGFLKAPLKYFRISSRYSKRRFHPVQKRFKAHLGTDYAAPKGTPILAVGDGKITEARYSKFNGNYVKIKHNSIYTTQYLHMSKIAKGMRAGKSVKKGQIIGYVGSTGLATGPHVCFRFWKNGKQVDGTKVKVTQQADPIAKKDLPAFNKVKEELIQELETISLEQEKELAYNQDNY